MIVHREWDILMYANRSKSLARRVIGFPHRYSYKNVPPNWRAHSFFNHLVTIEGTQATFQS